jgi:hypothetical protein
MITGSLNQFCTGKVLIRATRKIWGTSFYHAPCQKWNLVRHLKKDRHMIYVSQSQKFWKKRDGRYQELCFGGNKYCARYLWCGGAPGKKIPRSGAQKSMQSPRLPVCVSLGVIIVERLQMTPLAENTDRESAAHKKLTKGRARWRQKIRERSPNENLDTSLSHQISTAAAIGTH